jgi:heat shock protein HtpX
MISALRKIEGRGELPGATSAVMELCVDNPREGFADLFATHPSVESRIQALVKFAGGRDPGPLSLPSESDAQDGTQADSTSDTGALPSGPWSGSQPTPADTPPQGPWSDPAPRPPPGPWGPR